jgi:hypothetical protein
MRPIMLLSEMYVNDVVVTNEVIIKTTQCKSFPITRSLLVSKWRKAKGSRRKEKINMRDKFKIRIREGQQHALTFNAFSENIYSSQRS